MSDMNDNRFTCAFNTITRACIPHMDTKYAYFSDLFYDANRAVQLGRRETLFIVVRDCGTSTYDSLREALGECRNNEGRTLIAIQTGDYDHDFTTCVMRTA